MINYDNTSHILQRLLSFPPTDEMDEIVNGAIKVKESLKAKQDKKEKALLIKCQMQKLKIHKKEQIKKATEWLILCKEELAQLE